MDTLTRALELHDQGQLREAAELYVEILRTDPQNADALHLLGWVMYKLGHAGDALTLIDKSLAVRRRDPLTLFHRADVYTSLGRLDDAVNDLRRVVQRDADHKDAWTALALIELNRGRGDAAEDAARRGVPGVLGTVRLARGDRLGAARAYATDLVAQPDRLGAIALADALFPIADPPDEFGPALEVAFGFDGVDHSRFDRAVRVVLAPFRDDPARLAAHPLFAEWMSGGTPFHPAWEPALIATRRWLLDETLAGREVPEDAVVAFALYGWATEYPWPEEELPPLDSENVRHVAARAMFEPIPASWHRDGWEWRPLASVVRVTHEEPAEELRYAAEITDLTGDHPSSVAVRAMYEESPYPRVVSVHRRPGKGFRQTLRTLFPDVEDLPTSPVEVLVAGCGTGQHLIQSALAWPDADVTGIDLSLRSLGRAARITAELGLDNVSVARADLLELHDLLTDFDVVEAVGVLHHLEDPLAGWRSLRDHTRPGGLMRIGLYSASSRTDIAAARALIAEHGLEATPAGIREARRVILGLPDDHPARPVVWSPDFATVSGCRDLLFHVREHVYTFPRLREELDALGLELLGFQHALPHAPDLYRARWPDDPRMVDLGRWAEIEAEHPRVFSGMYVFWARRPSGDVTASQES